MVLLFSFCLGVGGGGSLPILFPLLHYMSCKPNICVASLASSNSFGVLLWNVFPLEETRMILKHVLVHYLLHHFCGTTYAEDLMGAVVMPMTAANLMIIELLKEGGTKKKLSVEMHCHGNILGYLE